MTSASPRYCWKTLSSSAVWIMANLHGFDGFSSSD
jgi:hypothetical protein